MRIPKRIYIDVQFICTLDHYITLILLSFNSYSYQVNDIDVYNIVMWWNDQFEFFRLIFKSIIKPMIFFALQSLHERNMHMNMLHSDGKIFFCILSCEVPCLQYFLSFNLVFYFLYNLSLDLNYSLKYCCFKFLLKFLLKFLRNSFIRFFLLFFLVFLIHFFFNFNTLRFFLLLILRI